MSILSDPYLKIKNSDERLIYVYDNNENEEELIVLVKEIVLDLKHKIEEKLFNSKWEERVLVHQVLDKQQQALQQSF